MVWDAIILGAGAAGMMAAIEAVQQRKTQVALDTRRMAVSLKELELASERAHSLM